MVAGKGARVIANTESLSNGASQCTIQKDRTFIGAHAGCEYYWCTNVKDITNCLSQMNPDQFNTPFQTASWLKAIINAETDPKHIIIVGFQNHQPVVLFPFALKKTWFGTKLTWLGEKISDYNNIIVDGDYRSRMPSGLCHIVMRMLHDSSRNFEAAHLIRVQPEFPCFPGEPENHTLLLEAEYSSHALSLEKNWKQLYQKLRSSKSRSRLKNKLQSLRKTGHVSFGRIRGNTARIEAATVILDWKAAQLYQINARNPFNDGTEPSRTRQTIENEIRSDNSSLQIFGLFLDGKLIAGMLAFVTKDTFYLYVTSFSSQIARKFSVGTQLLVKTLEYAARSGCRTYDFLIGDEPYKQDWCDTKIPLQHHAKAYSGRGRLICQLIRLQHHLKLNLQKHPATVDFIKHCLKKSGFYSIQNKADGEKQFIRNKSMPHGSSRYEKILLLGNYRPSLTLARNYQKQGYTVIVGSHGCERNCSKSNAVADIWNHSPLENDLIKFARELNEFRKTHPDLRAIIPVAEEYVRLIAENPELFKDIPELVTMRPDLVNKCLDKDYMMQLAGKNSVPTTRFASVRGKTALETRIAEMGYPVVLRPTDSTRRLAGKKVLILETPSDLQSAYLDAGIDNLEFVIQKKFSGRRHNVYFACHKGHMTRCLHAVILRTDQINDTGLAVEGVTLEPSGTLIEQTKRMLVALDYSGIGCAQYLVSPHDGSTSFLEINPRIAGNHALPEFAGLDLGRYFLENSKNGWRDFTPVSGKSGIRYCWTTGDLLGIKGAYMRSEISAFRAIAWCLRAISTGIRSNVHMVYRKSDPWPALTALIELVPRIARWKKPQGNSGQSTIYQDAKQ